MSKSQKAILYMIFSTGLFHIGDIAVKYLSNIPFGEVLFFRFFFAMPVLFLLIPRDKIFTFYKTKRIWLHFFRAVAGCVAIISLFIALRNAPLGDTIALTFLGPVFVTILSVLFLSEKVGIRRIFAVCLGLIGGLLIIKPTFNEFNPYLLMAIVFAAGFACVALSIRSLSKTEPNYLIAFYFSLLSMLVGLCTIFDGWVWPTKFEAFLFVVIGVAMGYGNILLTESLRLAEASLVTPIKYLSLVLGVLTGYFIFGESINTTTIFGGLLIALGSYIIFRREATLKKQVVAPRV